MSQLKYVLIVFYVFIIIRLYLDSLLKFCKINLLIKKYIFLFIPTDVGIKYIFLKYTFLYLFIFFLNIYF